MAITVISQPNQYQAGYNRIEYVIDSNNKNNDSFRYVIEIYDAGTSNKLIEYKVAPDPTNNGYGKIDISKVIQNKLDTFLSITSTTVNEATNTHYNYDIKFGESYSSEWRYDDYGFNNTFPGGNTGLFQSPQVTPHSFVVGDQIKVQNDTIYNDNRDTMNGYFTVIGIVNAYDIAINLTDVGSGPATPGTVTYADNRNVTNKGLVVVSNRIAVNVAQSVIEFATVQGSLANYINGGSTMQNLTNIQSDNSTYLHQFMFLNMLQASGTGFIRFENSNGDILQKSINGVHTMKSISVGPGNIGSLSIFSGTGPLIKDDTEWYEFWTTNAGGAPQSSRTRINLKRKCTINRTQILFMDRKGSYMSFAFPLRERNTITTEKEMYNQHINQYTTMSKGMTTYHSQLTNEVSLHTDWLTDGDNIYFEELLTSPYTYINYEGNWYSCYIAPGTFETERRKNKSIIMRSIVVKFSLNNTINI